MKLRLMLLLLLAGCGAAQAGALDECYARSANRIEVSPCLQGAQRVASDEMLALFQRVEREARSLEQATGRPGPVAQLKVSQRDFERYVEGQCRFAMAMFDSGTGAGQAALACEVDLLRQRAELLRGFVPAS